MAKRTVPISAIDSFWAFVSEANIIAWHPKSIETLTPCAWINLSSLPQNMCFTMVIVARMKQREIRGIETKNPDFASFIHATCFFLLVSIGLKGYFTISGAVKPDSLLAAQP